VNDPEPRDPYAPPPHAARPQAPRGGGGPPSVPGPQAGEGYRRAAAAGRASLFTGLAGLVLSVVLMPLGLVLDAVAIAVGVRARRVARAHGLSSTGAVTGIVLGLAGLALVAVAAALLWDEARAYNSCLSAANTEIAKANCRERLRDDVERRFGVRL